MPSPEKYPYEDLRLPRAEGRVVYNRPNPPADEATDPLQAMHEAEAEMEAFERPYKAASKAYENALELHEILVAWDEPEASVVAYLLPELEERLNGWNNLYWEASEKRARLAAHLGLPHYQPESEDD